MTTHYGPKVYREQGGLKFVVRDGGQILFDDQLPVTQLTSRATGVTCSRLSGRITTDDASLAAGVIAAHVVTNTLVGVNDNVIVTKVSGDVDTSIWVSAVGAGSFTVSLLNNHASAADTTALVYNFAVIKGEA